FLATMSHELRTPLNAINGYADLMDSEVHGAIPQKYHEYLERIRRSSRHLMSLITGVLDFSKLEAGRLAVHIEAVSMTDLLPLVAAMTAPEARDKDPGL